MEKLESTLEKIELKKDKLEISKEKPIYQGLKLIEDKAYNDGTSIKYWM